MMFGSSVNSMCQLYIHLAETWLGSQSIVQTLPWQRSFVERARGNWLKWCVIVFTNVHVYYWQIGAVCAPHAAVSLDGNRKYSTASLMFLLCCVYICRMQCDHRSAQGCESDQSCGDLTVESGDNGYQRLAVMSKPFVYWWVSAWFLYRWVLRCWFHLRVYKPNLASIYIPFCICAYAQSIHRSAAHARSCFATHLRRHLLLHIAGRRVQRLLFAVRRVHLRRSEDLQRCGRRHVHGDGHNDARIVYESDQHVCDRFRFGCRHDYRIADVQHARCGCCCRNGNHTCMQQIETSRREFVFEKL